MRSWRRGIVASALVLVGLCEMLTTTPWFDWDRGPAWLAATVATIGFLAFLALAGLATLFGNLLAGAAAFALLRWGWGWPIWGAALVATPYWIVFYRIVPTPW